MNVTGSVGETGKERAATDQVSISHAIGLLLEAYTAGVIDLETIVAQLDARHEGEEASGAGR